MFDLLYRNPLATRAAGLQFRSVDPGWLIRFAPAVAGMLMFFLGRAVAFRRSGTISGGE
jgi:hypothetical protein